MILRRFATTLAASTLLFCAAQVASAGQVVTSPTPEPGTILLIGGGLGALGLISWRKNRKR